MQKTKCVLLAAALVAALAACGHKGNQNVTTQSAGAGASNAGGTVLVMAGTDFSGKLAQPIGTKSSKDGDTFTIAETSASNPALAGSTIDGHVTGLQAAGPMHDAKMTLVFDDIRLSDGTKAPIDVQLLSTKAFDPSTHHLRTIGMMMAGAVAGHEIRKHTGHGSGLLGAAGGYVLSQQMKTDVSVPAGTVLELKFLEPVTSGASGS